MSVCNYLNKKMTYSTFCVYIIQIFIIISSSIHVYMSNSLVIINRNTETSLKHRYEISLEQLLSHVTI